MSDNFIEMLSLHGNKTAIQALSADELAKLEQCADSALIESSKGIGAIGELIFWSCQVEEPPIDNIGQIGLVLVTLSELLIKADLVRSEASYYLKKTNQQ